MSLELAVKAVLIGDTGVAALVGERVWIMRFPNDGTEYPAVAIAPVSLRPEMAHDGPVDFAESRIQVDLYADGYAEVRALADAVRQALDGFRGESAGEDVFSVFLENEVPEWGDVLEVYRVTQDYMVTWRIGV